ncbi:hypothetical protein M0R45_028349 [Rubus argutus]|uniref:pectinesterase n=1 Tax=Rubus argutus TaxID=59490 RepID=A0AAW1W4F1_RUBAR
MRGGGEELNGGGSYITAQGCNNSDDPSGFIFKDCYIFRSDPIWLGRNYRPYSRVGFADNYMENIIISEDWNASFIPEMKKQQSIVNREFTTYSETNCRGPGSDMWKRVPWEKKLSEDQANKFASTSSFIDGNGWLAQCRT